ncbi:FHA domain-containing protein [Aeromicrobium endophyticum]|uniref:FHA domain-containing protein n=1 Tax=Aeromicrobium endophyticum TaxID=2292704 RepID=UPI0011C498FA|nr:FHA domain-containing protein [Aeromicrobium endophyticum]
MLHLHADLTFDIETGGRRGESDRHVHGTIRAAGNQVTVQTDDLLAVAGQPSRAAVRGMADALARLGLVVEISGPSGTVVTMGAVQAPLLQRLVTRSRHLRLGAWSHVLRAVVARRPSAHGAMDLSSAGLPPGTPWPLVPLRPVPRTVTTTHDAVGGRGHPRLYLSDTSDPAVDRRVGVFALPAEGVVIGSAAGSGLRLDGVDDVQAEIIRTDDDEYVLIARSSRVNTTVSGRQLPRQTLHTGSRIQLGTWRLAYVRDEFADHGRPYGGRIGGELGRQRTQPKPPNRSRQGF